MLFALRTVFSGVAHVFKTYGIRGYIDLIRYLNLRMWGRNEPSNIVSYSEDTGLEHKGLTCIIIPTRDGVEILRNCINSIILKTPRSQYEITIVNNGSRENETLQYLDEVSRFDNVQVLDIDRDFNFSELNNIAAAKTNCDMLCFLNNDTEILEEGWLSSLTAKAKAPEVGAVGPLLVYPDELIQHAGIVVKHRGIARNYLSGYAQTDPKALQWLSESRFVSAVTAACLVVEKSKFISVSGFDEAFPVGFNDVDLCLRLNKRGFQSLFTPSPKLIHYESKTRGKSYLRNLNRYIDDVIQMMQKWGFR